MNLANDLDLSQLKLDNLNSCFKFNNYGISIRNFEKWTSENKSIYFNDANAKRAYKLLYETIVQCVGKKNENAYIQGIHHLDEITYYLKKTNGTD